MIIYVLNENLKIEGLVDSFTSVIWRPSYYEIGDFEIYLPASRKMIELFQRNRYVVRDKDITVDNGKTTYKNVMIVKGLELKTDVENGDFLTIKGRELKQILHQRIIWNQTILEGSVESGIRQLISENAINPKDARRTIPRLKLAAPLGLKDTFRKQITGNYLDETITEICTAFNYGWDMYISDSNLIARIYQGVDRSYQQSANPFVVFSNEYDNLYNTDYQMETEKYANVSLVAGEGEGTERVYHTAGDITMSGLDRFEIFTDARDLSSNKGTEDEIKYSDYLLMLEERGLEKLAECKTTEGFSGEIVNNMTFEFGVDFNIGDTVTVINEYGIGRNVSVISSIECTNDSGTTCVPQFNI